MTVRRTGAGALAAIAAAGLLTGCASQKVTVQNETVSTASAAAALAAAQNSTCPDTPPQSLTSNVSGLSTKLEPLDATRVLLCVYGSRLQPATDGSGSSSGSGDSGSSDSASASAPAPTAVTLTNKSVISSLQNALNALTAPPTARVNCPADFGTSVLGIFTDGQQVTEILMTTSGCPEASNGQKTGWVGASDFGAILSAAIKGA